MPSVLSKFLQNNDTKLFQFRLLQLEKFIFTEHAEMCWGIDQFFKNKYRPGIKSLSQYFEKEIYQFVNITWTLLKGKTPVLESLFNSDYCKIYS